MRILHWSVFPRYVQGGKGVVEVACYNLVVYEDMNYIECIKVQLNQPDQGRGMAPWPRWIEEDNRMRDVSKKS